MSISCMGENNKRAVPVNRKRDASFFMDIYNYDYIIMII